MTKNVIKQIKSISQPIINFVSQYFCALIDMIPEAGFGRPEDKDIEKQFMKKIRGDKLQAINAECELEICLAFKYGNKKEKTKNKRAKKKEAQEENETSDSLVAPIPIGDLQLDRRQELHQRFKEIKAKWKFEEILDGEPLPEYFFDDGCDLSFVIYELQNSGDPKYDDLTAEDLIFLELLCLEGRKLLNEDVTNYYRDNMVFMVLGMKNGLEKIRQKLKILSAQGASKAKDRKISNDDQSNSDENEDKNESKKQSQTKSKKIKKKAGKNKKGKNQDSPQSNDQPQQEEENYPGNTELAIKTCNYISWAYWYVIKKD